MGHWYFKMNIFIRLILIAALSLPFCASPVFAQTARNTEYRLATNDLLEISVYQEPDLSKTVRVAPDGTLSYPLLGTIYVRGLTAKELEEKITQLLAEDFLVNPQVSVFIKEYSKISVLGQVARPGAYELKAGMTVIDAIALSGGFTKEADTQDVKLVRSRDGRKQTFDIDADEIITEGRKDKDIILEPGDLIIAGEINEETDFVIVLGQVSKPGKYPFTDDMTVVEAIAMAGGTTALASPNRTKLIRVLPDGKKRTYTVPVGSILEGRLSNRNMALEVGDTIVVPESFF